MDRAADGSRKKTHMTTTEDTFFDAIIAGGGVSGSFIANELIQAGMKCLMLEAGSFFNRKTYPRTEVDANSQLYWGGGIELNLDATIGLLRPKVVGGGSIVNQALMDRFDDDALDSWRNASGVSFFSTAEMAPWYEKAEGYLSLQNIPTKYRNRNAEIFREGFDNNGYRWAPLRRAQRNCHYEDGNDCITCLWGCRIDSKQSTPVTVLRKALDGGLQLLPDFEVQHVGESADAVTVAGISRDATRRTFRGARLVMASGAIGNSKLLLKSGFADRLPSLGHQFYTHPQYMNLGVYEEPVNAHKGPLQSLKSADPGFRRNGFKLENVYAPPAALAMLVPGFGRQHMQRMRQVSHFACIEVAVRDTNPGRIRLSRNGSLVIEKSLNAEDAARRDRGLAAIRNIFLSTGAVDIIPGNIAIGLHLMGGCNMGTDPRTSVVSPEFKLHRFERIHAADSSIFPNAPGINPSLTIMALSLKGAEQILRDAR
jgi:choline dehydrogenase-like flavoprotein